ncbi:PAS domain-containing protein [Iodobacter arcticus]|uniref:PAS domain-containing protein n=1 Tax=Iodobacter arcticus TaxID=590593 RepID=A0ABW2R4N6_9NEIS
MQKEFTQTLSHILKIALTYAAIAGLGVVLSSKIIEMLYAPTHPFEWLTTLKDWLLIVCSVLLLYVMWKRLPESENGLNPKQHTSYGNKLGISFSLLALVILLLSGAGIAYRVSQVEKTNETRIQIVTDVKLKQITDWLKEREGDAELLKTSLIYATLYQNWRQTGDLSSKLKLLTRLEQVGKIKGFSAASLLDSEGKLLWSSSLPVLQNLPNYQATLHTAAQSKKVQRIGPYPDAKGQPNLDFIAPLTAIAGPTPFIVLHSHTDHWLSAMLQTQPLPSPLSESLLFSKEGNQLVLLNGPHFGLKIPAISPLQSTQLLPDNLPLSKTLSGKTMGILRAVPNSNWFLLTQIDQSALYSEIIKDSLWISLAALLALLMTRTGYVILKQQEQLILATNIRQLQTEHLQSVKLLSTIADSSEDAIFAKDLEGRYILFNRAACRFINRQSQDVLGQDDRAIFPPDQAEMLMDLDRQVILRNTIITQEEVLDMPNGQRIFLGTKGPLCDEKGNTIGVFGISRDITERKQAEMVLKENEERFRALVEQSLAGIYIIQKHRLSYVNHGFARIFGHEDAQALIAMGQIEELVSPHDKQRVSELILQAENGELSDIHFTFTGLQRSGAPIEVEFYGRKVDDKGHPALIGLLLDITERKAVEHTLTRQSEELLQRNAELERFNQAMVDRELEMIELKRQIKELNLHQTANNSPDPLLARKS